MEQPEGAAMAEGAAFLKIVSPFYFLIATKLVSDGVLRGSGMMRQFMIGTLTDMIVRVILVYILSAIFGSVGIWLAWPFSFVCGTALSLCFYSKGIWKDAVEA
jgi:Na+-driven multidrug efflux pump